MLNLKVFYKSFDIAQNDAKYITFRDNKTLFHPESDTPKLDFLHYENNWMSVWFNGYRYANERSVWYQIFANWHILSSKIS